MMFFQIWKRPSRYVAVLFLVVAAMSVIALVWMGARLVQQDRALEAQRLEEQQEVAADRIIVALEKVLSEEEQKLAEAVLRSKVESPCRLVYKDLSVELDTEAGQTYRFNGTLASGKKRESEGTPSLYGPVMEGDQGPLRKSPVVQR